MRIFGIITGVDGRAEGLDVYGFFDDLLDPIMLTGQGDSVLFPEMMLVFPGMLQRSLFSFG